MFGQIATNWLKRMATVAFVLWELLQIANIGLVLRTLIGAKG